MLRQPQAELTSCSSSSIRIMCGVVWLFRMGTMGPAGDAYVQVHLHLESRRALSASATSASCCPAADSCCRRATPRSQGCASISAAVARRDGTYSSIGSRKSVSARACGAAADGL